MLDRRSFIQRGSAGILAGSAFIHNSHGVEQKSLSMDKLDAILAKPVLKKELFPKPVILKKIELLQNGKNYTVRVTSQDGAVGMAVSNNMHMKFLHPILVGRVFPAFKNQDARQLDRLIEKVYISQSNYKYQGLALWVSVASIEFAILDLLGIVANKPVGELVGKVYTREIEIYKANNNRGKTAEQSLERIIKSQKESQAKAIKFKVGGRMSKNADFPEGRTEKLIPMVREALGDEMTIYADSNGSYDVKNSIRVGKILEEHKIAFFEEPCPFDQLQETKMIADGLKVPIAGGECETSMWRFKWLIANKALQVVQPDLFYFGGMIRSIKVARMAEASGIDCTPHISGSGIGALYMLHFASCIPNPGAHQEYKGSNFDAPFTCDSSTLTSKNGVVKTPSGPGLGITLDKKFIEKSKAIS
ncbi:MAG: mandelate racemase/muconate lactonizing enzyme family protein [Lentisphaeraceae bacterium]|nr:mandelate racemase/muconate lactonizing enzyme family protein [Lentisphaeraceae bacterium]